MLFVFFLILEEDLLHVATVPQTSSDLSFFSIGIRKHSPGQILLFFFLFFFLPLSIIGAPSSHLSAKTNHKRLRELKMIASPTPVNVTQCQLLSKCQKKVMCGELRGQLSVLADYLFRAHLL